MTPETLLQKAMDRIQAASRRADVAEIDRMSRIAKRLNEIALHLNALNAELIELGSALDAPVSGDHLSAPNPLPIRFEAPARSGEVEIIMDWPACGLPRPRVAVSEPKASDTLVAFISELNTTLGPDSLRKLTQLKVSRGPLLSENPAADFLNSKRGTQYAHQQVPGTPFFVLTHSSTDEKLEVIRAAWRALGLPHGGLSVKRVA